MTQPSYEGPERRADAQYIQGLREAVLDLSERVGGMTEALENTSRQAQEAQDEAAFIRAQQHKDRRRTLAFAGFAALMIAGLVVALVLAFVGLHREHTDFVDLRAASVSSCQTRNAQARNLRDFYTALGNILIEANRERSSPALQSAIDAFAKATKTVPKEVDCGKVASAGDH